MFGVYAWVIEISQDCVSYDCVSYDCVSYDCFPLTRRKVVGSGPHQCDMMALARFQFHCAEGDRGQHWQWTCETNQRDAGIVFLDCVCRVGPRGASARVAIRNSHELLGIAWEFLGMAKNSQELLGITCETIKIYLGSIRNYFDLLAIRNYYDYCELFGFPKIY